MQTVAMRSLKSKSLFGIALFTLALLPAGTVYAANNNTLTVTVVDASDKPLPGAKVEILALNTGGKWQNKNADKTGLARFEKLEDGAYRIVARPEGLAPTLHELVLLRNGAQEAVTVKCSPGDPATKFYWEDPQLSSKAVELQKQAEPLLQQGNFPEAEKMILSSLEANPSSPDGLYYLAYVQVQQKKWDQARATLQRDSKLLDALVFAIPGQKDAKGVQQPSRFEGLQKMATTMLAMLPSLKLKDEGNTELTNKNFKQAIAKYQEAIKAFPNDPDTYYNLSIAYARDNQFDTASQALDQALKLRPDDTGYQSLKQQLVQGAAATHIKEILTQGDTLFNGGDFAAALKKYEEALPLVSEPKSQALIWDFIGKARDRLNQSDQAVDAFNRALTLDPQNAQYKGDLTRHYQALGLQFMNEKQYDQAFATYEKAGQSVFDLGLNWYQTQKDDLAIVAFERVLKTDPQNAEAYYWLGMAYWDKKDSKLASDNLSKYVQSGKDPAHLDNAKSTLVIIQRKK